MRQGAVREEEEEEEESEAQTAVLVQETGSMQAEAEHEYKPSTRQAPRVRRQHAPPLTRQEPRPLTHHRKQARDDDLLPAAEGHRSDLNLWSVLTLEL